MRTQMVPPYFSRCTRTAQLGRPVSCRHLLHQPGVKTSEEKGQMTMKVPVPGNKESFGGI